MEVLVLAWPDDASKAAEAAAAGVPRLLLLGPDEPPPHSSDPLQDWIRLPATDADIDARMRTLRSRGGERPSLEAGVVRHGDQATPLSPVEDSLLSALLEKEGAVVYRDALARAAWPDGPIDRNALDAAIRRLRKRIAGTGVSIATVRGRGYMAETSGAGTVSDSRQELVSDA